MTLLERNGMAIVKLTTYSNLLWDILDCSRMGRPYKLNFAITQRCNSHCRTCNNWKTPLLSQEQELTLEEIGSTFQAMGYSFSWFSITGGEPFLRPDLTEIVKAALSRMPRLRVVSIISNGLLREPILSGIRKILGMNPSLLYVKFSIDGPEPIHTELRGMQDGYQATMETYREVLSLRGKHPNLDVGLETTVSDLNAPHLEDFIRRMRRERVDLTLAIGHQSYLYQNIQDPDCSPRKHLAALETLVKILIRSLNPINPKHYIQRVYLKNIPIFFRAPGRLLPCTALKASCALNAQGDIYPCLMWERPLGNIRSTGYSIEKILDYTLTSEVRSAIERKECPLCWTPCEAYQSIFNHLMAPWVKAKRIPGVDSAGGKIPCSLSRGVL